MLRGTLLSALCLTGSMEAKRVNRANPAANRRAQAYFNTIMTTDWADRFQGYVNMDWGNWTADQKRAIFERMQDQGLLSPSQIENWGIYVIPTATVGG